ncbi:hypothetical protein AB0395_38325 [Streptosporangium sp. NPDC051023]|uniref:hypothetical protein n=1 Tax=Streptosporangium sp. NPDC051023 TaxID=3155410 RepID=UPI00344E2D06
MLRHRVLTVLLLLAATVVITPGTACACSCAPLGPAEQVGRAAAVFTGTVVSARPAKGDPLGPRPPIIYTFRADQVYKGRADAEYQVATNADSAACGYGFTVGSRYLVLASDEKTGLFDTDPGVPLHTALCDGNLAVRAGEGPLHAQDAIQNGEPLSAGLLSALGTATRPRPTSSPAATPVSSPSAAISPWLYAVGAAALLALAFAGWRLSGKRRM